MVFVLVLVVCFTLSAFFLTGPSTPRLPNSIVNGSPVASPDSKHKLSLPKLSIPSLSNPFAPSAHQPKPSSNSTKSGDITWLNDWTWLNPFSSSVTLDENRAVLPPLAQRPPIYTFYETSAKKDDPKQRAEDKLLLTWRRAWWAQGFRPIVLSRAESLENPLYAQFQMNKLEPKLEADMAKWLAWGRMGTGILANWLVFPMGAYDDPLLTFLRRGGYPELTRYEKLPNGLFVGEEKAINDAIKQALENTNLKKAKDLVDAVPSSTFSVDPKHDVIAFYDAETITKNYPSIGEKLIANPADGLAQLPSLINSHLHIIFQNKFKKGIAVLKPMPEHSTILVEPAMNIATYLTQCADTPLPNSCPPNRPKCSPCISSHPLPITMPRIFRNMTELYTIGTVPHPYTRMSLVSQQDNVDVKYLRRSSERDPWLAACTKEVLGTGVGSAPRAVRFKEMVASSGGAASSLWLTPEKDRDPLMGLSWFFGFSLPTNMTDRGEATPPVPGSKAKVPSGDDEEPAPIPDEKELKAEGGRIKKARDVLKSKIRQQVSVREATEAWNLADTEAWRFARAWTARRHVEREKWEHDEGKVTKAGAEH
ncbi:MAG: hypothetical protein M1814_005676 [Vezdaea aestivalis]|nr:MAG: hypothetical protein M1814_005676 [Vezdaea aestivalis]